MLKKLTNKDILKEILRQGVAYSDKFLMVKYKKNGDAAPKRFLVVSTAVSKKAVVRNKLKRRSRAILDKIGATKSIWLAIFFRKGSEALGFKELKEKLSVAVKNIK